MTTYYLVGIGTGHVLAQNKGARSCGVVLENKGEHDDEQKWTVEFGDEPDVIALKCVANGEYMNSPEREETGPVNIGDKQWWNISTAGLTPQVACRFSLVSSPEQFIYTSGNVLAKGKDLAVQRREWRASDSMDSWQKDFGFYFVDTSTDFKPAAPMPASCATPREALVGSNAKPQSKYSSETFYFTATKHSGVLSHKANNYPSVVVFKYNDKREEEKWDIEYGDEPDTIALKCVAVGKYLRCFKAEQQGKVGLGDRQWWKMSNNDLTSPGAFTLAPVDSPKFSLTCAGYSITKGDPGLSVHVREFEKNSEQNYTWRLMNAQGSFNPSASVTSGGAASKEESDAKLKALEDREAALLQKESDQSAELDKKAKELQERQDALDQEEKKRAASKTDFDSKLKALEDREAKLTQKDKDRSAELDKKEKEIQALQDSLAQQEKDREAASTKKDSERSAEWDKQMKDVQDRQDSSAREDKDREATSTKKNSDSSAEWDKKMKEVQERQDALAKEEKDRAASYEKKLKDLQAREDEMAKKEKEQKSSKETSSTKSGKDATAKPQSDKKDAETQRKLDDLKATEQKVAADRASLEKSKADFAAEQKRFEKRQKAFEDQQSSSKDDASQAKNENAALEKRMAQLEDQLTQMDNTARNSKSGKPQANANGTEASSGCNYSGLKHYKPPRKLGRKVIGIVYE